MGCTKKPAPVSPEIQKLMQQKLDSVSATIPKYIRINGDDGTVTITKKDGSIIKKKLSDTSGTSIVLKAAATKPSDSKK